MTKEGKVKVGDNKQVDHKNMRPTDNRRSNLRVVSAKEICHGNLRGNRGESNECLIYKVTYPTSKRGYEESIQQIFNDIMASSYTLWLWP